MVLESNTPEKLDKIAREIIGFAGDLKIWCFRGEMGAGKTTLIGAITHELETEDRVSSPSFAIINEYQTKKMGLIYHFDFYRISEENEALDIGTDEYLESGKLCLIEWPDRIDSLLPEKYLNISIAVNEFFQRTITLKKI